MSRATDLCDRFGYPDEFASILDEVAQLATRHLGADVGVVLSPSVSTGDFLWRRRGGAIEFLSDVDGFVFTEAPPEKVSRFEADLERLSSARSDPFFELDFSYVTNARLGHLPESYQMVETGLSGFELVGEGRLAGFPKRFDPRASRQSVLLNLWKPLSSDDPDALPRNLARSLLDIPLIATSESGTCRPGHRARAEAFLAKPPPAFAAAPELEAAVRLALEARHAPPGDGAALAQVVIPALRTLLARIDGGGAIPDVPDAALVRRFSSWLPSRPPRRLLGELRSALRRPGLPWRDIAWWVKRKEALGAAACWGLLVHRFGGAPLAESTLACLADFARAPQIEPSAADLLDRAREQYRAGFLQLYPSRER
ncbi:MAG: hypothetical protein ACPGVZ_04025 [Myxococcota bacterium]